MEDKSSKQLLKNPEQKPSDKLFKELLSEQLYQTWDELQKMLSEIGLVHEWRYYNDGKAWLCKITHKKKTVVWLSFWENCIKTSYFFTDKTRDGIMNLDIDNTTKTSFLQEKKIGKLIPLTLNINHKNQLDEFKKITEYKMALK